MGNWTKSLVDAMDALIHKYGFENEITRYFCDLVELGWLSEIDMLAVAADLLEVGEDSYYILEIHNN